jgi:hypothetical protein
VGVAIELEALLANGELERMLSFVMATIESWGGLFVDACVRIEAVDRA